MGVAHCLDLIKSLFGCTIKFEFKYKYVIVGLNYTIRPTFTLLFFGKHKISANDTEDKIERVVEVTFTFGFCFYWQWQWQIRVLPRC